MHVKTKALELIENYNLNGKHYKVIPRKEFGEDFFDGQYFFLADYHLDSENRFQKKTIGFKQRGEDFFEYYGKNNFLLFYLENIKNEINSRILFRHSS